MQRVRHTLEHPDTPVWRTIWRKTGDTQDRLLTLQGVNYLRLTAGPGLLVLHGGFYAPNHAPIQPQSCLAPAPPRRSPAGGWNVPFRHSHDWWP